MKRIISILLILCAIFLLAGCGSKKVKKTSLSATITEVSESSGKIVKTLDINFTDDVATSAKETRRFSNKKIAEQYRDLIESFGYNSSSYKISMSGNTVTETYSKLDKSYQYYGMSLESVKTSLINAGWEVK